MKAIEALIKALEDDSPDGPEDEVVAARRELDNLTNQLERWREGRDSANTTCMVFWRALKDG